MNRDQYVNNVIGLKDYIYKICSKWAPAEDIEDAVQTTLYELLKKDPSGIRDLKNYVSRTAQNVAMQFYVKKNKENKSLATYYSNKKNEDEASEQLSIESSIKREELLKYIESSNLNKSELEIMNLKLLGYTYTEIEKLTGLKVTTIRSYSSSSIAKIRESVKSQKGNLEPSN